MTDFLMRSGKASSLTLIALGATLVVSSAFAAPAKRETLKQAVALTMTSNPSVLSSEQNKIASEQLAKKVRGGFLPSVSLDLSAGRERTMSSTTSNRYLTLTKQEKGVTISQLLYDGGSLNNEYGAQKQQVLVSEQQLKLKRQDTALKVATAYLEVLNAQTLIKLAKDNVVVHRATLKKATIRFKGGAGRKGDADLVKSRLALANSELIDAEGALKSANARFEAVTGHTPSRLVLPKLPVKHLPKSLADAQKQALIHHPALNEVRARYNVALSNRRISKSAAYFPTVRLELTDDHDRNISGTKGSNNSMDAMVKLSYSLFNGGSDLAKIRESAAKAEQARQTTAEMQRTLEENVRLSWSAFQVSRAKKKKLESYVRSSKEVVKAYQQQFTLGQRQLFNVLDAENELFHARTALSKSRSAFRIDNYRLLASMGQLLASI